jgi:hypothetical protein
MISRQSISLRASDMRAFKSLEGSLPPNILDRFKSLVENGCLPLHLNKKENPTRFIHVTASNYNRLGLSAEVQKAAKDIIQAENRKLRDQGIEGEWIDGEKLAVTELVDDSRRLFFSTSVFNFSHILAMKDFSFDQIAGLLAFKLDTNTHVLAKEGKHRLLLVGQRGRKPGEPRMGSEALCAPVGAEVQWTLATNGILDLPVLVENLAHPDLAWINNSFKEFEEELGISKTGSISYLATMVDPHMFTGAMGILGAIETDLTPKQIHEARKLAKHAVEVPVLDTIPMEEDSIATYLRVNRNNMVPQLVTGLVVLGFESWGKSFLVKADK